MNTNLFTLGAFAIIFDDSGRVLLSHRRDYDMWNLPGGGVERGELPTEAVIRETKEETGYDVSIDKLVGVYTKNNEDDLVFTFLCRVMSGELRPTEEADNQVFFDIDQLPVNTIPKHVERIHDAIKSKAQPIFRRQSLPPTLDHLESLRSKDE